MVGWVVSVEWLADHRDEVTIVDVRDSWEYDGIGHIPGARNIPFDAFRSEAGEQGMLPVVDQWRSLLSDGGIQREDTIVVYDDTHGVFAARFVLTAIVYGHGSIALLDGDFSAWQRHHPTETSVPAVSPSDYGDVVLDETFLLEANAVVEALESPDTIVVDTRDPAEFEEGHLPGAVNLDWIDLVNQETRGLHSQETLESLLADKGVTPDRRVVLYCNTARRLSHTFVALKHLGFEEVVFYEGSLTDWLRRGKNLEGSGAGELTVDDVR